jgi:hypothetical protein
MKTGTSLGRFGWMLVAGGVIANALVGAAREAGGTLPRTRLVRGAPMEAGATNAPLLFCIGMHIEPFGATPSKLVEKGMRAPLRRGRSYELPGFFRHQIEDIRRVAEIVERHGGRLTIQAQTPFTRMAA